MNRVLLFIVAICSVYQRATCQPTPAPAPAPSSPSATSPADSLVIARTGVQQPLSTPGACREGVFVPWASPAIVAKDRNLYPDFDNLVLTVDNIYTNENEYYFRNIILCCGQNVTFGFQGAGTQSLYVLDTFRCPKGNTLPASGITVLQSAAVLVGDQLPVTLNKEGQFYFADLVPGACSNGKTLLNVTVVGQCPGPPPPPPPPSPPIPSPLPAVAVTGNTTSRQAAPTNTSRPFGQPAVTATGAGR